MPWWLRVVWVCHVLCVVSWLFLAMIRTYVVMYVFLRVFLLLLENPHVVKKTVKLKSDIIFWPKVYRDSKQYIDILLLVLVCRQY